MASKEQIDRAGTNAVEPGYIIDFIDSEKVRKETPEEYVRQEILKSLVREYGYPKEDIDTEVMIKFGSSKKYVDIAVFTHGASHTQDKIAIIIETKKPSTSIKDKKEGVEQLHSYTAACPNACYSMWTNGKEMEVYIVSIEGGTRKRRAIADLPKYGDNSLRPLFGNMKKAASDSLLFAFSRCHDYIAGNQGLQKTEAFFEFLKLIFCKIHDEKYSFPEPEFYITDEERQHQEGRTRCTVRIQYLFSDVKKEYPDIFKPSEEIELNNNVISYVVSQLQWMALLESDVDVKGRAYETIVGSNLRGDRGEFFTPRNVCSMMVRMVNPKENELVLDPACGTGGFLITAMNHVISGIREEIAASRRSDSAKRTAINKRCETYLSRHIVGMDFNPILVRASKMNMVMNNDGSGQLFSVNSLESFAKWNDALCSTLGLFEDQEGKIEGSVDVIVTNPPFGSKLPIDDPSMLAQYDLGHVWNYNSELDRWIMDSNSTTTRPPEILFIERCVRLLKRGTGRMAIVLPDGILGNPGLGFVRQWILEETQLLASVDMHADTFEPNVGVQTSVLLMRRLSSGERLRAKRNAMDEYYVFMAICDHIGHDKRGVTTYKRDSEGYLLFQERTEAVTGSVLSDNDIYHTVYEPIVDDSTQDVAAAYSKWLDCGEIV